MTKKITFISYILPLCNPVLSFLLIAILTLKYTIYFYENENAIFWLMTVLYLLFFIIPSFILQINYTLSDKKTMLIIDESIDLVRLIDNEKEFSFKLSDVDRIRMIHSKNDVGLSSAPWSTHYFYMICLKNDDEFLVTRLIGKKLDKLLNVRIIRKKVFFPFITKYYLDRAKNKYDKTSA